MYLSVGIAIYNESTRIIRCLNQLRQALMPFEADLYLCFNGCTDDSREKTEQWLQENSFAEYHLLQSDKGKTIAQNTIIVHIQRNGHGKDPVVFLDADVWPEQSCILTLYNQLFRIDQLLAVGALTIPESTYHSVAFYILNVRNLYPLSEVCMHDVSDYKWYTDEYPQEGLDPAWERKNKIYFHGRCFMLKRAELFSIPADTRISDDTYLPNMLHLNYGPGVIRNIFSARVYYKPYESIAQHWRTYWRIYNDKRYLDVAYPQFRFIRQYERTVLDLAYIKTLPRRVQVCFRFYRIITRLEQLSYRLLPKMDARKIWEYKEK